MLQKERQMGVMTVGEWLTLNDRRWMQRAIEFSKLCPPVANAYSVGAILVEDFGTGKEMAYGYSRETNNAIHAEEAALAKVAKDDPRLRYAAIYSTLEPCTERKRSLVCCARFIIALNIPRVVIAWREPSLFVTECRGYELLTDAGIEVVEMPEFTEAAKAVNSHLKLDRE
jgi:diaminohydroxyphosphoribosylaminopyrimidine deaminase/5-amino-6-(5-phosphoribosylamino)uracil reductase